MKLVITPWKQRLGVFAFCENTLVEANVYDVNQEICIGDIYLGRVNKILPNIGACFVGVGQGEEVFLPLDEVKSGLKSGEYVPVQIKKEASKGKNALATTKLSLSGIYCVVNNEPHSIEVSSKLDMENRNAWKNRLKDALTNDDFSEEDKRLLSKYCVIIRTNVSEAADFSEVIAEWLFLAKKMEYILDKGKYQSVYSKLYSSEKTYLSYIKNVSQSDLEEIITDDAGICEELRNVFHEASEVQNKIRLYQDEFSLSKLYCLESKMADALSKKVWLKCGGFLVIEPTEALTVIDVNSGKFDKKISAQEYYKKVNEEAAVEIARQLKLRNISGIIIVDFINMSSADNNKALLEKLKKCVANDSVKTYVVGMTSLGLVEITRTKKEKPLWEQVQ